MSCLPPTLTERAIPPELLERLELLLDCKSFAFVTAPAVLRRSQSELLRTACLLAASGFPAAETELVLRVKFFDYDRPLDDREISRAVEYGIAHADDPPTAARAPRYPEMNIELVRSVTRGCDGALDRLKASSPTRDPGNLSSGEVIDRLFPAPEALLCMARSKALSVTPPRSAFIGMEHGFQFLVPSAMSAPVGLTVDGRDSVRCNANVGPIQNQIVEFDSGSLDEQAALLTHLAGFGVVPLRAVVFSGGKSLHGWFDVAGREPAVVENLRSYVAGLGADRAMFTACQLARTPNATRVPDTQQPGARTARPLQKQTFLYLASR